MGTIIIIGLIILVIFALSSKAPVSTPTKDDRNAVEQEKYRKMETPEKNIKVTISSSTSTQSYKDETIIDITDKISTIIPNNSLQKYPKGVPPWSHQYIYSYSEINSASNEQRAFYTFFKQSFLNAQYFELDGYFNYAFILLFDLLGEYDRHNDITKLEKQLQILGQYYPRTKSYSMSFLIQKMESRGDILGVSRIRAHDRNNSANDYDYWRLGGKYKTKLKLTLDEEKLLNKLNLGNNNFCSIEFCFLEILKLYIAAVGELKVKYVNEGTTLEAQFSAVADVVARKHFRFKSGSNNYKYSIDSTTSELYVFVFRHCENTVREYYGHKRKVNTDTYSTSEAKLEIENKIISKITEILPTLLSKIALPDETTEIELYAQNTNRWKIKFESLVSNYNANPQHFFDSIITLASLNKKNPSIENIFFEASKFISKYHNEQAINLYIHYLYYDLKSATFDNKQLTKTIQKNLFKTSDQLHNFEMIVSELIHNKDLEKALQDASKIYTAKRKKIQLDSSSIEQVQMQHSGTVELLNEYLSDEYEDENNVIHAQAINSDEMILQITKKKEEAAYSIFIDSIAFTSIHTSALEIFSKNNFSLLQSEMEIFAKSKGIFKNQLIESINDICFDYFDDILIEEEDEYYTINQNYYNQLLSK